MKRKESPCVHAGEYVKGVAEAATVLGLSGEQVSGTINALVQMSSKGRVQLEELRAQLGDRIPGTMAIAAKAMGVTESQLGKMIEAGQVASDDFLPRLGKQFHLQFGEAAKSASGNAQSAIYNFQNSVTKLQANLGKAIAPTAMVGMNALAAAIQSVAVHMDKVAIAVSAASAVFLTSAIPAIKTALAGLIVTSKILPLTAAGWMQVGLSVGKFAAQTALLSGAILLVKGIAGAVNSELVQSFNNAAKSAQNAAKAANDALTPKGEKKSQALAPVNWLDQIGQGYVNAGKEGKVLANIPFLGLPAIAEWINRAYTFTKTGKADHFSYADLQKQNLESAITDIYGGGVNVAASTKLSLAEFRTGKGQFAEIKQIEEELKKAEEGRRILQANIQREFTDKGLVVPFDKQKELEGFKNKTGDLVTRRAEAIRPLMTQLTQVEQQIENTKNALQNLNDPNTIAAIGGEQAATEQREKLQASLDGLRRIKTEIDEAMSKGADPLQSLIREFKHLAYAIDEAERSAKNFGAQQRAAIATTQLKNFATDPLAARSAQMAQLQADRDAIKKSIESRSKAVQDALERVNDPSNAGLMAELNVNRDTSVTGLQKAIDYLPGGDENKGKKELLDRMKSAKELEEQLLQDKASLAQQEVQIRQQAEQDALYAIQQSVAKQDAAIRQGENSRVSFVKGQQKQRLATEEQVAESLARIQLDSSKKQFNSTEQELAAVRAKHKEGAISAEQFAQQERELATKLSDQKRQIAESDLAVQEAINRRRIANVEFTNRQEEAAIEASQAKKINKIKARVASGKLSDRQAQPLILKEQATGIGQQEEGVKKQMQRDRILRSQNAIDDRELANRNVQNNQKLTQLEQQRQENRQQQNQQALQDLEFTNKRAEAMIEASQQRRTNAVKQRQADGVLSERQAAEEITKVQASTVAAQIAETHKQIEATKTLQQQGKLSAEDSTTKQIELNQRLGQLNQQGIESEIQANQQLIASIEFVNKLREQNLELATAQANAQVKGSQARGDLSDRQAQQQLTSIQRREIASRLANAQQQLAGVNQLPLSLEEKKQRRLELKTQIAQLQQQQAEATIQANQQIIQSIELANQRAESAIEASQQRRVNIIKQKQSEGALSERQVAQETTKIQHSTISQQIELVKKQIAQTQQLEQQGEFSKEESATKQIELNQRLGQLNQQRIESEIQANQQLVDSIEYVNNLRRQELDLSNALAVASIKHRQARGQISERQAQSDLNQAQRQDITKQIAQAQQELTQVDTIPKLSNEQRTAKRNEIKNRLVQLSQQEADAVIQYNQQAIAAIELANQRAEQAVELSQAKRINIVKQKQQEGALSERQAQTQISQIQGEGITKQVSLIHKQISDNKQLKDSGIRSTEEAVSKEQELNLKLAQINGQRIDNEVQKLQQLRDAISEVINLKEAELDIDISKKQIGLARQEADFLEAAGSISPLRRLELDGEGLKVEQDKVRGQRDLTAMRLADLPRMKYSPEQEKKERLNLQKQLAQLDLQFEQNRGKIAENAFQKRERLLELGGAETDLRGDKSETDFARRNLEALKSGKAIDQGRLKLQQDLAKLQVNRDQLLQKQADAEKRLAAIPESDRAKRVEATRQLDAIQRQLYDNEAESIRTNNQLAIAGIEHRIEGREQEADLLAARARRKNAEQEAATLEGSGGLSDSIAQLQQERVGLQAEQRALQDQLQGTREKLTVLPQRKLGDRESAERNNLLKAEEDVLTRIAQNRSALAKNVGAMRDRRQEIEMSRLQAEASQRELEFGEKELAILRSGVPLNSEILKLDSDRNRLLSERETLLLRQKAAERLLADLPTNAAKEIRFKRQTDVNEAKKATQHNTRALLENEQAKRIKEKEIEISQIELDAQQRGIELQSQELALLRTGVPFNQELFKIEQEKNALLSERETLLIKQQRAASDVAKLGADTPKDTRIEKQKALNDANKALYDNERSLIENNRKAAEAKADQQIADARRTAEAAIASAEAEKSAQDRVLKTLDLQKGLVEARANLQKAISDAGISDQEGKLEATSRAVDAMKRLQDEENIDPRVKQALEAQVRDAGLQPGTNLEQGIIAKQQIEGELARRRIESRLQEEAIARRQLEIETKRNELTAKMGLMEAQITLQKAQQAEYEAKLNQAKEIASGDSDRIQQAEFQYAIAQQQRQQAEMGIQLANENISAVREAASLEQQRLNIQQQMVANQSKSAEKAREEAQALEKAEAAAKGIAGANRSKSESGGSSGQGNNRILISGSKEDMLSKEASESFSKAIQSATDAQSQQRNLLDLAMGSQRDNAFFFEKLNAQGMNHIVKLADTLRGINPIEVSRVESEALMGNQNVIEALERLGGQIEKLSSRPSVGTLQVSSSQPVNDAASIMRDITSNSMRM